MKNKAKLTKKLNTLKAQDEEIHAYEEKIHHLADQMISIDLDDGVMKYEYSVKTWTKKLSRYDIEQISNELLPITRWNEDAFDINKKEIKKKYGISSNALSDAIDIIKNNPLFANNINLPIALGSISDEELKQYAKLISEFTEPDMFETKQRKAGDGLEELLKRLPKEAEKRDVLSDKLSNDALISLAAFGDMFETGVIARTFKSIMSILKMIIIFAGTGL